VGVSVPAGCWLLFDKPALVRGGEHDPALGELCLCAVTRFEVLYSARSQKAFRQLETELDAVHELRTDIDQAAVLHLDRHYDTLARVLAFTPVRLEV